MTSKPLVAVIADTQLHKRLYGLQESRQDWFDAFASAIDQTIARIHEISAVCMPGDILDKEEVGSHAAYTILNGLKRLAAYPEVPVFILLGNHDQPEDTKLNWVNAFQLVHPNVIEPSLTKPTLLPGCPLGTYKPLAIYGTHHMPKLQLAQTLLELPKTAPTADCDNWLLLHQALRELAPHPDSFEVECAQVPAWFSKVLLGDFHDFDIHVDKLKRQFIYPGSTETVSFNQSEAPGFILVNRADDVVTHVSTQQREYITVKLSTLPTVVWKHALLGLVTSSTKRFNKLPVLRVYYPAGQWDLYAELRAELKSLTLHLIDLEEESKPVVKDTQTIRETRLPSSREELISIAQEELAFLDTPAKDDASKFLSNPASLKEIQTLKFPKVSFKK